MAYITNAEGNYFMQESLARAQEWLTCTGVGDIEIPEGDLTPVYCQDPLNSGQFKIEGFIRGDRGAGTYTLTKPLANVYNFLLETRCAHQGRINWVCRGLRQDPRNFELAMLLIEATPSRRGVPGPVREPDGTEARVNTTLDLSYIEQMLVYNLTIERQALANVINANAVYFLPERCEDRCGAARGLCQEGVIGLDATGYLGDSEIKKTHDSGAEWAATINTPYTIGGNTDAVLIVETRTGARIIAFRSEELVGDTAVCAYTEDWGATAWTEIQIGLVNNQAVQGAAFRGAPIYACGSDGFIWMSVNQAGSWAESEAGVETNLDLNAICFTPDGKGFCVGITNAFLYLAEGSNNWTLLAGPDPIGTPILMSVAVNLKGHVFVGTNDGRLFRSEDDGVTWVEWLDFAAGTIPWVAFDPQVGYVGAFIRNTAGGVGSLHRSEDGGASWWEIPNMPAKNGLNSGFMCDQNNIIAVGNVDPAPAATTFVVKTRPA